jgi:poly(A) polymerase Pap1
MKCILKLQQMYANTLRIIIPNAFFMELHSPSEPIPLLLHP